MTEHTLYLPCGCVVRMMPAGGRDWLPAGNGVDACPMHAAAPDMLEALESIIRNAGYESGKALPTLRELRVDIPHLDAARAAIAKARRATNAD